MRNLKADPYDVIRRFGHRIIHFHAKDIYRHEEFEIEPAVGMGQLAWNHILAFLYHHHYQKYIVIEPHGPLWSQNKNRKQASSVS